MSIDFVKLQTDVADTKEKVDQLLSWIDQTTPQNQPYQETPLSIEQAAELLGIAPQTIYQNIKKIPRHKRFGRLYFFKSELLEYLKGGQAA